MQENLISSEKLDYISRPVFEPQYSYLQVSLLNQSSGAIPIAANASTSLEFKLPPSRVVNFGRSYIQHVWKAPLVAAKAIGYFEDVSSLASSISLSTSNNTELMRLDNVQQYQKIVRKIDTSLNDMMTNDDLGGLYRSNKPYSQNPLPAGDAAGAAKDASESYLEPFYMETTDTGAALNLMRHFKFSSLKSTILGLDRDFYCPSEMYLRIQTPHGDNIAWSQANQHATPTVVTSLPNLTLNNVTLFLAVEMNKDIIALQQEQCLSGKLEYSIPYIACNRQTGDSKNGITAFQIAYNNSYGHRLKRIITCAMPSTDKEKSLDADNTDGAKIVNYQTSLDNVKLQDRILSCETANADDWAENRVLLGNGKDTSCYLSRKMYACNWFHMDSFTQDKGIGDVPEVNLDRGLDMAIPRQWQWTSKVGDNDSSSKLVHYTFAEFYRPIRITPLGAELVPYPLVVSSLQTRG